MCLNLGIHNKGLMEYQHLEVEEIQVLILIILIILVLIKIKIRTINILNLLKITHLFIEITVIWGMKAAAILRMINS